MSALDKIIIDAIKKKFKVELHEDDIIITKYNIDDGVEVNVDASIDITDWFVADDEPKCIYYEGIEYNFQCDTNDEEECLRKYEEYVKEELRDFEERTCPSIVFRYSDKGIGDVSAELDRYLSDEPDRACCIVELRFKYREYLPSYMEGSEEAVKAVVERAAEELEKVLRAVQVLAAMFSSGIDVR